MKEVAVEAWRIEQADPLIDQARSPLYDAICDVLDDLEDITEREQYAILAIFWERITYQELAEQLGLKDRQSAHDFVQRITTRLAGVFTEKGIVP